MVRPTCCRIFSLSSGATAVRDNPPAIPPATSDLAIDMSGGRPAVAGSDVEGAAAMATRGVYSV
jgi:hypothetical protein